MGYQVQSGVPLTFFHAVRDLNGNFVAGQAASITKLLLKPDRSVDAVTPVILVDDAVAGWVRVTITPPLNGEYTLTLTNPAAPTADGIPYDYEILASGFVTTVGLLTSLERVKGRLSGPDPALDSLINLLISEVSDEYQGSLGRTIAETDYIQYLDGTNRSSLVLGAGPLVSVTSLHSVEYRDDGAGGVTEVLTLVPRHSYVLSGLRTWPRFYGLGRIDLIGEARFTPGVKNYKATFRAGFSPIPEAIVGLATNDVVTRLLTRETGHLLSKALADGTISYLRPQQMLEARETGLAPFLLDAA